jgi:hypothetical protein
VTTTWTARPTTYKGIKMRSRLEATYAARLDELGEDWTYEPRAYADSSGQYLPDFEVRVAGGYKVFIEVRPTVTKALEAMGRMEIIWSSEPLAYLVIDIPDKLMFVRYPDTLWECRDPYNVFGEA